MKTKEILEAISKLSSVEVAELVEGLKIQFGIDDSMLSVSNGGGQASSNVGEDTEITTFKVVIKTIDETKKTAAIKGIKTILNIGLGDAKGKIDAALNGEEVIIKGGITKAEADALCKEVNENGMTSAVEADS